ncbi:hypothetical protein B0186_08655 [Canicola haemoglobinophilus]|uniref:Integrase n=1 Tax=Canicola haemoglobinophilus TaxID=733 RepID=A0A1V4AZU5_9PAST|nr:integrase arm-type DNA-binding domain-containing protein [Canicola haemoglobinophilus]OOR98854.1 hypothetical protein B0186_08655 [Canicola haemoglobinophilus]STO60907.1 integrase [Canicola haemoglobinophilus]
MAKGTSELTATQIKNAKPREKDYKLMDGKGLFLLVRKNGSKLWRFRYKKPFTGNQTDLGLGTFPEISLLQARRTREDYLVLLAQNIDPKQHKDQTELLEQQRISNTFKSVAESWRDSKQDSIKPLTLKKYWSIVEKYLLSMLSDYPVADITPIIAKNALNTPYKQGKAEIFRKSIKLLNAILNYAVYSLFIIPINPCSNINTAFEPLKRGTNPNINPDALPEFLDRLEHSDLNLITKYLIQWQLLTMVRPNEAVTAEWGEIDIKKKLWIIPPHKMKKTKANENKPHIVPLSSQALEILERIKQLNYNSVYVFPSLRTTSKHINSQTVNKAIRDNLGYKEEQTAHGLRKIASTYLHEKEVLPDVIEMCLAHTIGGIRGVYNNAEYLKHRARALQLWGDYVEQCRLKSKSKHLKIVA